MTKIKNVEEKVKDNGKKSYKFFLEDGVSGYITNDKPWDWKAGEEVTYTKEEKKTPNGSYNLLTLTRVTQSSSSAPVQQQQQGTVRPPSTAGIQTAKSFNEMKFEGRIVCIKLAVECILQGKFERPEAILAFQEWVTVLDASIDELKSK